MMLSGKVVAVTGGFGQLGGAVIAAAVEAGARAAALDRAPAPPKATRDVVLALGGLDLAAPQAATRALEQVTARFGRLDVLVNVAGTFRAETVAAGSVDTSMR